MAVSRDCFLIRRHQLGLKNGFSELEPELFNPDDGKAPTIMDVSGNPARRLV